VRNKLSIAIPVRNGEIFLKQTLDCIPNSCTVIVSDNLSTDSTFTITMNSNIDRVIQPNSVLSMSENWNFVTSQVTSEYFRLCSHDDLINPLSLQAHVDMLDNDLEAVAVFSRRDFLFTLDKKEIVLKQKKYHEKVYRTPIDLMKQICLTGSNPIGETFAVTFRTKFFSSGLLCWRGLEPIHELDTYLTACGFGKIIECDVSAGQFRVHINSYSGGISNYLSQARAHRQWLSKHPDYRLLGLKYRLQFQVSSRFRAIVRTFLFTYLRLAARWR